MTNPHDVREFLRKTTKGLLYNDVYDTADMFELGMHCFTLAALRLNGIDPNFVGLDSFTFRLLTALLAVVNNSPTALHPVPGNVTYTFQTIDGLADYVAHRLTPLSLPAHRANVPYVKWLYISRLLPRMHLTRRLFLTQWLVRQVQLGVLVSSSRWGCIRSLTCVILGCSFLVSLLNRKRSACKQERPVTGFQ